MSNKFNKLKKAADEIIDAAGCAFSGPYVCSDDMDDLREVIYDEFRKLLIIDTELETE